MIVGDDGMNEWERGAASSGQLRWAWSWGLIRFGPPNPEAQARHFPSRCLAQNVEVARA